MTARCLKLSLILVLLAAALLLPSGCGVKSYDSIRYDGRDYIACGNTILLDYRQSGNAASFEDIQKSLLTKTGEKSGSTVSAIKGLDGWIYCHNESMLATGPDGVYHLTDIKMNTVQDFSPDSLQVYALTKPTATGSGSESLYGGTTDQTVIDSVVKSILSGEALTPDALSEAHKKNWSYDNAEQYRLEFKSTTFPNLIYLYDYTVGEDGKCYILSDKIGYEADNTLLNPIDKAG